MFFFSLPVIAQQMNLAEKILPLSEAQRVLLLVKDADGGEMLQKDLTRRGYETDLCLIDNETDWLASLLLAAPDVAVLDLGLTSESGWEILKIMKENPAIKDTPVLFYTIEKDADHGSLLEIDYLTKPVGTLLCSNITSKGFPTRRYRMPGSIW
jgi:CheY-like chemotaxis protein